MLTMVTRSHCNWSLTFPLEQFLTTRQGSLHGHQLPRKPLTSRNVAYKLTHLAAAVHCWNDLIQCTDGQFAAFTLSHAGMNDHMLTGALLTIRFSLTNYLTLLNLICFNYAHIIKLTQKERELSGRVISFKYVVNFTLM